MAGVEGRMLAIIDITAWMASQEIGLIVKAVPS
jgi:hypothetical protein